MSLGGLYSFHSLAISLELEALKSKYLYGYISDKKRNGLTKFQFAYLFTGFRPFGYAY